MTGLKKTAEQQKLIDDALTMIRSFGIPTADMTPRAKTRMALALLALAGMKAGRTWPDATNVKKTQLTTREIIKHLNENFNENISSGSYDDIRRKDLKPLLAAGIVEHSKPDSAHNNPGRGYGISPEYHQSIIKYGMPDWQASLSTIKRTKIARSPKRMTVSTPNLVPAHLSFGEHNKLQKKVIEEMMPVFCHGDTRILYLGDATNKQLINDEAKLKELRFFELKHRLLPDIVAYSEKQNVIYLIEAVYTSNPISPVRKMELESLARDCKARIIYITAFLNKRDFRKNISNIAWETEVWLADNTEHMIHFDGNKFLSPY